MRIAWPKDTLDGLIDKAMAEGEATAVVRSAPMANSLARSLRYHLRNSRPHLLGKLSCSVEEQRVLLTKLDVEVI